MDRFAIVDFNCNYMMSCDSLDWIVTRNNKTVKSDFWHFAFSKHKG